MMETDKQEGPFWTTHDFYHGEKKGHNNYEYHIINMQHFLIEIHLTSIINYQHYKFINLQEQPPPYDGHLALAKGTCTYIYSYYNFPIMSTATEVHASGQNNLSTMAS